MKIIQIAKIALTLLAMILFAGSCKKEKKTNVLTNGTFTTVINGITEKSTNNMCFLVIDTTENIRGLYIKGDFGGIQKSTIIYEPGTSEDFTVGTHTDIGFYQTAPPENNYWNTSSSAKITSFDKVNKTFNGTLSFIGEHETTIVPISVNCTFEDIRFYVIY